MIFSIIILAMSLSIDAFSAGLVYGLRQIKIPLSSKLLISLFSVIYTFFALLAGKGLSQIVPYSFSKLFGAAILTLMGVWIIIQTFIKKETPRLAPIKPITSQTLLKIGIKSLGITIHIFKNPMEFDLDSSGVIDTAESLLLGLGLSLDAIGVGIGSALLGFHSLLIPLSVGLFQWFSITLGVLIGENCAQKFDFNQKWLGLIPGIILIIIAILRV